MMRKLGVPAIACTEATTPRGSAALWGATAISWTSAKAAIFFISSRPPQWRISGWMMAAALRSHNSRKPQRVAQRSPVAMGMEVERVSSSRGPILSVERVGSSTKSGLRGSSSRRSTLANAGLVARWKSMAMSMAGPTASRMAAIRDTTRSIPAGLSMGRTGSGKGVVLSAVKPSATRWRAAWAACSGVGPPAAP